VHVFAFVMAWPGALRVPGTLRRVAEASLVRAAHAELPGKSLSRYQRFLCVRKHITGLYTHACVSVCDFRRGACSERARR